MDEKIERKSGGSGRDAARIGADTVGELMAAQINLGREVLVPWPGITTPSPVYPDGPKNLIRL